MYYFLIFLGPYLKEIIEIVTEATTTTTTTEVDPFASMIWDDDDDWEDENDYDDNPFKIGQDLSSTTQSSGNGIIDEGKYWSGRYLQFCNGSCKLHYT